MRMDKEARRESRAIAKELKRNSELTPAAKLALESAQQKEDKIELATKFVSQNAGWGRLFQYYRPLCVVALMIFLSMLASCALPGIAIFITKLQFIYYGKAFNPSWE